MGVVKQRWIPRRLLKQQSTLTVNKPISRSKGDYFRKLDKRTEFFLTLSLGVSIIIWYTLSYISYGDSLEVSVELPTTSTLADVLGDREEAQIDDDLGVYQEEELLVGYDDNTDDHHENFEDDLMFMNHPQDFKPGIAWLMSYPNSGTSFTMTLAFEDSNTTVATNYVKEVKNLNMPINPLYKNSTLPVLLRPDMNLPSHYILTKTHCRGTCVECGPRKYITSLSSFTNQCASSHGQDPYEVNLVKKAVHITRDPIDNIVSNFRLKYEQKKEKKDVNWLSVFTKDIKGFRRWCNAIDDRFVKQEKNRDIIPREISKHFDGVPCHGLFYKYVTVRLNSCLLIEYFLHGTNM
jgi:hypothetical protein